MSLQEQFEQHAEAVKSLPTKPTNDELLELYGLYKQATVGDNNTSKPWAIQLTESAKWQAWEKNKGMPKETAQEKYIELVKQLQQKYGAK